MLVYRHCIREQSIRVTSQVKLKEGRGGGGGEGVDQQIHINVDKFSFHLFCIS